MKRITIIGSGGAGKSTFAAKLGEALGIPVIHLDAEYWKPGWVETPREQWILKQEKFLQDDSWIIDGNYGSTMELRLQAADTIIFLDISRWICLYSVVKRRMMYHNKTRPDMGEGCNERIGLDFLKWVYDYPKRKRPAILQKLTELESKKNIYILKTRKEVAQFLRKQNNLS